MRLLRAEHMFVGRLCNICRWAQSKLKNENRLNCEFNCTSHLTVQGKPCPWSGVAWYELDTRRITLRSDPAEKHAPCEKKFASGLTTSQQRRLELQPAGLGAADAYDVLCTPADASPQELQNVFSGRLDQAPEQEAGRVDNQALQLVAGSRFPFFHQSTPSCCSCRRC